jgi:hypothetical protein
MERFLHIAAKFPSDEKCYAVTKDSLKYKRLVNPDCCLGTSECVAEIRLRGVNVDQTFRVKFQNAGGKDPLDPIEHTEIIADVG